MNIMRCKAERSDVGHYSYHHSLRSARFERSSSIAKVADTASDEAEPSDRVCKTGDAASLCGTNCNFQSTIIVS